MSDDARNKSGPGHYGDALQRLLKECGGDFGALVVIAGPRSQSAVLSSPAATVDMVKALRELSDGMVRDARLAARKSGLPASFPSVAAIMQLRTIDELIHEVSGTVTPRVENIAIGLGGTGRYADELKHIAEHLTAIRECVLIVMTGTKGPGFAAAISPRNLGALPETLRVMAAGIEGDLKAGKIGE